MITFRSFLLVTLLVWVTPLLATAKMAVAYGCFKLISWNLHPNTIRTAMQQLRLTTAWGVGWAIAVQNLDALKQGDYQHFGLDAGFRIGVTAILAALTGLLWFRLKLKHTSTSPSPPTHPPKAEISPLLWLGYLVGLLLVILFKTGIAQFQLGNALTNGVFRPANPKLAQFWFDQAQRRGYPSGAINQETAFIDKSLRPNDTTKLGD